MTRGKVHDFIFQYAICMSGIVLNLETYLEVDVESFRIGCLTCGAP